MDPVTLIGLVAVAAMFSTGVALVWLGLRRRPDRLPAGADVVLDAVMAGRLGRSDHLIDLVHPPALPPRAAQPTPAVRLLPKTAAPEPATATAVAVAEPTTIASEDAEPAVGDEPAASPAAAADLSETLFDGIDDPSTPHGAFFEAKPQLQRF